MTITIEDMTFELSKVRQLYPAAMIPSGYGEELTQISLEWYDTNNKQDIKAKRFGIFINLEDKSIHPFYYDTRELLEKAMLALAAQLPQQ